MTKLDIFNTSLLNDFSKGAVGFDNVFKKMTDFHSNLAKLLPILHTILKRPEKTLM
jgi:hypothetical protein